MRPGFILVAMAVVAVGLLSCDMIETPKSQRSLSPAEAALRSQAVLDSAARYDDSLNTLRKADSANAVKAHAQWRTDSLAHVAEMKTMDDGWKKDSAKAVASFKADSVKARKQHVKDSLAWAKDSLAGVKALGKDSLDWEKKAKTHSSAYDKSSATIAKKYTKDSGDLEAARSTKFAKLLANDSAAVSKAQAAVDADNDATKAALKSAHQKALTKANAKLAKDLAAQNTAIDKAAAKLASDSTAGEATLQKLLGKRQTDSTSAAAKRAKDSGAAAAKVANRLKTWNDNHGRDSGSLDDDTAKLGDKMRSTDLKRRISDSLHRQKWSDDSMEIARRDSLFLLRKFVPVVSPKGGWYASAQTVSITSGYTGTGTKTYYTTDGSIPDSTKTLYAAPFSVAIGQVVKAITYKPGYAASAINGAEYVIGTAATPLFSSPTVDTAARKIVVITSPDTSDIYYTLDGSAPNTGSPKMSGAKDTIVLTKSTTIKLLAVKKGRLNAAVVSQAYTLVVPAPVFGFPRDTTIVGSFLLQISDSLDSSATIRYTIDGTTPTATSSAIPSGSYVQLDSITTIKAIAFRNGVSNSRMVVVHDTVQCYAPDSVSFAVRDANQKWINVTSRTTGATVYWITGSFGSEPPDPSPSNGLTGVWSVPKAEKVKAIAVKHGMKNSAIKEYGP